MAQEKINLLINLPGGFFRTPELQPELARLEKIANIRKTSHNTIEELTPELSWPDAVLMWAWPNFTDKSLEEADKLRFIGHINATQTQAKAAFKKGIAVSEVRHAWSPAVAELALGLILSGLRRISEYHMGMRNGTEAWIMDIPADIDARERELTGQSVGIVGFGRIGQRLAELLAPFHVDLRIYDPYLPSVVAEKFSAKQVSVMELVKDSDIVVLCAANNEGTKRLIDEKEIAAFKKDSLLVNVGRSSLINMSALERRLEKEDMFAMLDVFDVEPLEQDSPLRGLKNACLTPHRGGGILPSVKRSLTWLTDDLEAFLNGRERKYTLTEGMFTCLPE